MKTSRTGERIPTQMHLQSSQCQCSQSGRSGRQIFVLMWRGKARVLEIQGVRWPHIQNVDLCPKGSLNCLNPATNSWVLCGIVSWGPGPECVHPGQLFTYSARCICICVCVHPDQLFIYSVRHRGWHIVKLLVTKISVMFMLYKFLTNASGYT